MSAHHRVKSLLTISEMRMAAKASRLGDAADVDTLVQHLPHRTELLSRVAGLATVPRQSETPLRDNQSGEAPTTPQSRVASQLLSFASALFHHEWFRSTLSIS